MLLPAPPWKRVPRGLLKQHRRRNGCMHAALSSPPAPSTPLLIPPTSRVEFLAHPEKFAGSTAATYASGQQEVSPPPRQRRLQPGLSSGFVRQCRMSREKRQVCSQFVVVPEESSLQC